MACAFVFLPPLPASGPVRPPPTALNAAVTADEDTTYTFSAADFNFSDAEGDTLAEVSITKTGWFRTLRHNGQRTSTSLTVTKADLFTVTADTFFDADEAVLGCAATRPARDDRSRPPAPRTFPRLPLLPAASRAAFSRPL